MTRKKLKMLKKDICRDKQLYLFLLLPIVYILIFHYVPMSGVLMAFKDYSARKGIWQSDWVGLKYFKDFFESYKAYEIIRNTLVLSIYHIIAGFPIPVIFALVFNCLGNKKYQKITQTIATMPNFISVTVLVGILYQLFNSRSGLYGNIGFLLNGAYPEDLFASASSFRHFYVWSDVWQSFGWGSIIYIAALSGVDPELHDAARIDGATRFQRIRYIDFPSILPTIVITLILRLGNIMAVGFEKTMLMQNSLNLSTSNVISTYVYQVGLDSGGVSNLSYATAVGLFNSVVNLIAIISMNWVAQKFGDTSLW